MSDKHAVRKFRKNDARTSDYGSRDVGRKNDKKDDARKRSQRHLIDRYYTRDDDD